MGDLCEPRLKTTSHKIYSNNELKYVGNPTFNHHGGCECLYILNIRFGN